MKNMADTVVQPLLLNYQQLAHYAARSRAETDSFDAIPCIILAAALKIESLPADTGNEASVPILDSKLPAAVHQQLQWPPWQRCLLAELHSGSFIDLLEYVSGRSNLLPDPFLGGAGLRRSGDRVSSTHTLPDKHLDAALMLLIPLRGSWHGEWSGEQTGKLSLNPGDIALIDAEQQLHMNLQCRRADGRLLQLYYYHTGSRNT